MKKVDEGADFRALARSLTHAAPAPKDLPDAVAGMELLLEQSESDFRQYASFKVELHHVGSGSQGHLDSACPAMSAATTRRRYSYAPHSRTMEHRLQGIEASLCKQCQKRWAANSALAPDLENVYIWSQSLLAVHEIYAADSFASRKRTDPKNAQEIQNSFKVAQERLAARSGTDSVVALLANRFAAFEPALTSAVTGGIARQVRLASTLAVLRCAYSPSLEGYPGQRIDATMQAADSLGNPSANIIALQQVERDIAHGNISGELEDALLSKFAEQEDCLPGWEQLPSKLVGDAPLDGQSVQDWIYVSWLSGFRASTKEYASFMATMVDEILARPAPPLAVKMTLGDGFDRSVQAVSVLMAPFPKVYAADRRSYEAKVPAIIAGALHQLASRSGSVKLKISPLKASDAPLVDLAFSFFAPRSDSPFTTLPVAFQSAAEAMNVDLVALCESLVSEDTPSFWPGMPSAKPATGQGSLF